MEIGSTIVGTMRSDGYFIFYVDHNDLRRMVLVNNLGTFVKSGILLHTSTWQDSGTWIEVSTLKVTLENFQGIKGKH